jgi:ligand-binding sensor domain-containing protein/signal transduction histidine kinase
MFAIDGKRAMSQYLRQRWDTAQGLNAGTVNAIAQTPDGYLWIGADRGLFRFDGQRFVEMHVQDNDAGSPPQVLSLTVDTAGVMWVRMREHRMFRYEHGRLIGPDKVVDHQGTITAVTAAREGGILIDALVPGAARVSGNQLQTIAPAQAALVISIAQLADGTVWLGTRESGLFYIRNGHTINLEQPLPDTKINCLLPSAGGQLWIGTDNGLALWSRGGMISSALPALLQHVQILSLLRDRDQNLWIGTSQGLIRYNSAGAFLLPHEDGHSGNQVGALFQDAEGNIWLGDEHGIERIRDSAFTIFSTASGMPAADNYGPVYADADHRTWFAPSTGGLYWERDGEVHHVPDHGLDSDIIYSIDGAGNDLWLGRQRGGLTHLRMTADTPTLTTYTQRDGLAQNSIYAVHRSRDGSIWAGTLTGGVSHFAGNRFVNFTTADGLASNTISALAEARDGRIWLGGPNGLASYDKTGWHKHPMPPGSASTEITSLLQDNEGMLWIGTTRGLLTLQRDHIVPARVSPDLSNEQVFGIAEDAQHDIWLVTGDHVAKVNRNTLLGAATGPAHEFGIADGLLTSDGIHRDHSIVVGPDGRIWLSLARALAVATPAELSRATQHPPVANIESILLDSDQVPLGEDLRLSAAHRLTFGFTGLSFAAPERVRFRYRLDGFDRGWSEPTSMRQAIYTNLPPGSYRFRVMASNVEGIWDSPEASLPLRIAPRFWQTWQFTALCCLALFLAVFAAYHLHMRNLVHQANVRFEERLSERTRIARELHDTLLQGLLSASLRLHYVAEDVPADSPEKQPLNDILKLMDRVVEEGRQAVGGLRSSTQNRGTLASAFQAMPAELNLVDGPNFEIVITGTPRSLHPVIHDEVCRIGREAILNAIRHADAQNIRVLLEFTFQRLCVRIQDDGRGMEKDLLQSGRQGHWGIAGMRERASQIGSAFRVDSVVGKGTEVTLGIPSHIAFRSAGNRSLWRLIRRWLQLTFRHSQSSHVDAD